MTRTSGDRSEGNGKDKSKGKGKGKDRDRARVRREVLGKLLEEGAAVAAATSDGGSCGSGSGPGCC
jgi:hypothetical protein